MGGTPPPPSSPAEAGAKKQSHSWSWLNTSPSNQSKNKKCRQQGKQSDEDLSNACGRKSKNGSTQNECSFSNALERRQCGQTEPYKGFFHASIPQETRPSWAPGLASAKRKHQVAFKRAREDLVNATLHSLIPTPSSSIHNILSAPSAKIIPNFYVWILHEREWEEDYNGRCQVGQGGGCSERMKGRGKGRNTSSDSKCALNSLVLTANCSLVNFSSPVFGRKCLIQYFWENTIEKK